MTSFRSIRIANLTVAAVMAVPVLAAVNASVAAFAAESGSAASARPVAPQPAPRMGGGDGCDPGRQSNFSQRPFYEAVAEEIPGETPGVPLSTPGGIYADILTYSPFVKDSAPNNVDSAWVMIQDGTSDWLQAGWSEAPGGARSTFYQAGVNGVNFKQANFAATAINSTHRYTVTYAPTGTAHFKVQQDTDTPLFVGGMSWVPTFVSMGSESQDQGSQFPGGSSNAEAVSNGHIWPVAGTSSSWQDLNAETVDFEPATGNPPKGIDNPPSWMKYEPFQVLSGTDFIDTWDSACGA